MNEINFDDFLKVDLRVGQIITANEFPQARNPSYILEIDFGPELGVKKSSAQITQHYSTSDLIGKLIVAVINLPKKQIGPIMSECLVTGFHDPDGSVLLCKPDRSIPLGTRLL